MNSILSDVASGAVSLADVVGAQPEVLDQLVDKAMGLAKYGKLDEASKLLSDLTWFDRRSAMLPLLLGTVRATAADHEGAVAAYGEALAREEASPSSAAFRAELWMLRARSALALQDRATAEQDLRLAAAAGADVSEAAAGLLRAMEGADEDS
ncbi:MAG: hypothetical protein RMA76_37155 [Deltaproteobacteria bacterium]|jgi:hypothetical protein